MLHFPVEQLLKEPQVRGQRDLKVEDHSVSGAGSDDAPRWGLTGRRLTPKQYAQQQRRLRALQLKLEGKTFSEIADELGWSGPSGAAYAVRKAREELNASGPIENAEEIRYLSYWRLEALFQRIWPHAVGGWRDGEYVPPDLKSMKLALRIISDEIKLTGVDRLPLAEPYGGSASGVAEDEEDWPDAILVAEIDEERFRAAMARSARNEPIPVDDQPPAGYIAPRPDPVDDAPDNELDEPDSVDGSPPPPLRDPRTVFKLD